MLNKQKDDVEEEKQNWKYFLRTRIFNGFLILQFL